MYQAISFGMYTVFHHLCLARAEKRAWKRGCCAHKIASRVRYQSVIHRPWSCAPVSSRKSKSESMIERGITCACTLLFYKSGLNIQVEMKIWKELLSGYNCKNKYHDDLVSKVLSTIHIKLNCKPCDAIICI